MRLMRVVYILIKQFHEILVRALIREAVVYSLTALPYFSDTNGGTCYNSMV